MTLFTFRMHVVDNSSVHSIPKKKVFNSYLGNDAFLSCPQFPVNWASVFIMKCPLFSAIDIEVWPAWDTVSSSTSLLSQLKPLRLIETTRGVFQLKDPKQRATLPRSLWHHTLVLFFLLSPSSVQKCSPDSNRSVLLLACRAIWKETPKIWVCCDFLILNYWLCLGLQMKQIHNLV